mgnify:CR=1 FL=1
MRWRRWTGSPGRRRTTTTRRSSSSAASSVPEFLVRVSYLEVYNEEINDLLQPLAKGKGRALKILRDDPQRGAIVEVNAGPGLLKPMAKHHHSVYVVLLSVDVLREQTVGMNLRDIISALLEESGLLAHYRAEREGADRVVMAVELHSLGCY